MTRKTSLIDVARVVLLSPEKKMLLVMPTLKQQWHCPGGQVRSNESTKECALRETLEETSLLVKIKRRLIRLLDTRNPLSPQRITFYLAHPNKNISKAKPDGKEIKKVGCFDIDEIGSLDITDTMSEALRHISIISLFV